MSINRYRGRSTSRAAEAAQEDAAANEAEPNPPCNNFRRSEGGASLVMIDEMYSVTKKIEFCYGHRLLDYDGICKHPHGHNATAEIEVRTGTLDNRNMVCDFSDIKRLVKGWIDRELDHKMILRRDDPLVAPLQQLGEPVFIVESNPTVEHIARLIFERAQHEGLPVVKVTVWETPTSFATYHASGD
jgi:6-pyruvoyltetrahydropterin/6-carboxytetrahydropterin synthase